jgi:hypothetical protein
VCRCDTLQVISNNCFSYYNYNDDDDVDYDNGNNNSVQFNSNNTFAAAAHLAEGQFLRNAKTG